MPTGLAAGVTFAQPFYLWLLVAPATLLLLGFWQILRRRTVARRSIASRVLPIRERYALMGQLGFWVCLMFA